MITERNFLDCAQQLGCPVWNLRTVHKVESNGSGFYAGTNKLVLKFEGHVFHHYTKGKYDKSHPHLSYPQWTEKYSEFGEHGAYIRFNQAFALDPKAAMLSTSWGSFQIMGENYSECGFKTVDDFVTALRGSDLAHLIAFVKYIISRKLQKYLVDLTMPTNAAAFAYRYNGALYQKHNYNGQLMTAAIIFKKTYIS
jgi:hypothetical protein